MLSVYTRSKWRNRLPEQQWNYRRDLCFCAFIIHGASCIYVISEFEVTMEQIKANLFCLNCKKSLASLTNILSCKGGCVLFCSKICHDSLIKSHNKTCPGRTFLMLLIIILKVLIKVRLEYFIYRKILTLKQAQVVQINMNFKMR